MGSCVRGAEPRRGSDSVASLARWNCPSWAQPRPIPVRVPVAGFQVVRAMAVEVHGTIHISTSKRSSTNRALVFARSDRVVMLFHIIEAADHGRRVDGHF